MKSKLKEIDKFKFELLLISVCSFLYGYDPENKNMLGIGISLMGMLCLYIFSVFFLCRVDEEYKTFSKYLLVILNLLVGITVTTTENLGMRDLVLMLLLAVALYVCSYKCLSWAVLLVALLGPYVSSKFLFSYGLIILAILFYKVLEDKGILNIVNSVGSLVLMVSMTIYRYPADMSAWRPVYGFTLGLNVEKLFGATIAFLPVIIILVRMYSKLLKESSKKLAIIAIANILLVLNFALTNMYGNVLFEIATCVVFSILAILLIGEKEDAQILNSLAVQWKQRATWYYLLVIYILTLLPLYGLNTCAVAGKIQNVYHHFIRMIM